MKSKHILALIVLIILNAFWVVLFLYHIAIGMDSQKTLAFSSEQVKDIIDRNDKFGVALDAVSYANQLGRLDVISLLLAFFGIIIAIAAIGWFGYVRNEAKLEARETAKEEAKPALHEWLNHHEATVRGWMQKWLEENPDTLIKALENIENVKALAERTGRIDDESANQIADAQKNDDDGTKNE